MISTEDIRRRREQLRLDREAEQRRWEALLENLRRDNRLPNSAEQAEHQRIEDALDARSEDIERDARFAHPIEPQNKRGIPWGTLLAAAVLLGIIGAGVWAIWHNRDNLVALMPSSDDATAGNGGSGAPTPPPGMVAMPANIVPISEHNAVIIGVGKKLGAQLYADGLDTVAGREAIYLEPVTLGEYGVNGVVGKYLEYSPGKPISANDLRDVGASKRPITLDGNTTGVCREMGPNTCQKRRVTKNN